MSGGLKSVPSSNTGTSICSPSFFSWSIAAGRYTSVATRRLCFPCALRNSASFPQAVVLPTPCRPAISMTVGPSPSFRKISLSPPNPPMSSQSSSATTLVSCCDALTPLVTLTPMDFSSTLLMKRRTTGRDTSASRSARRISLRGKLMFSTLKSSSSFSADQALFRRSLRVPNESARVMRSFPRLAGRNCWKSSNWIVRFELPREVHCNLTALLVCFEAHTSAGFLACDDTRDHLSY
mmetsp:Transcript_14496/g.52148  ORF Transcript_14496/g.52148 Transcript_14496/m.52148 type:complete len:237 (+) Transcript_14496:536-1246(+)